MAILGFAPRGVTHTQNSPGAPAGAPDLAAHRQGLEDGALPVRLPAFVRKELGRIWTAAASHRGTF